MHKDRLFQRSEVTSEVVLQLQAVNVSWYPQNHRDKLMVGGSEGLSFCDASIHEHLQTTELVPHLAGFLQGSWFAGVVGVKLRKS